MPILFKVIGLDGNEYGPVEANELRDWLSQGLVTRTSLVQDQNESPKWLPLEQFEELLGAQLPKAQIPPPIPAKPPLQHVPLAPLTGGDSLSREHAKYQLQPPALCILLGSVVQLVGSLVILILSWSVAVRGQDPSAFKLLMGMGGTLFGTVSLIGVDSIRKLKNYKLARYAAILALIPCGNFLFMISIPGGIWALRTLNKPEIKSQFEL